MKWVRSTMLMLLLAAGCSTPQPTAPDAPVDDPMIAQWTANAQQAFDRGAVAQAEMLYRTALSRAIMADDSAAIGQIAYGLAVCQGALQDLAGARQSLAAAERAWQRAGRSAADAVLLDANMARRMGSLDEAEARLDGLATPDLPVGLRLQASLLRVQVACDREDLAAAERHLMTAESLLSSKPEPLELARFHEAAGRYYVLANRLPLAADHYDQQAIQLRKARQYRDMAVALDRAGDVWLRMDNLEQAGDRYYRAARSLLAQGDSIAALQIIDKAVTRDSEGLEDAEVMREIAALFEEIQAGVAAGTAAE